MVGSRGYLSNDKQVLSVQFKSQLASITDKSLDTGQYLLLISSLCD